MLRVWKSVRVGVLALTACAVAGEAAAGFLAPAEQKRIFQLIEHRPMVFFVAKGPAGSCGKGCSEWIAAVGRLDNDAPRRLREFVGTLNGRKPPVFFHSPGGTVGAGVTIGRILREHRMTVGVGRTEAKCRVFDKKDAACQNKIKVGESFGAQLITRDAVCLSACVDAFAGGSSRYIARDAHLGVHASYKIGQVRSSKADNESPGQTVVRQSSRLYFVDMGINPDLVDFSANIPSEKMYFLDRQEIARFGLDPGDRYETPWILTSNSQVVKSVTRRTLSEDLAFWIRLSCSWDRKTFLSYRRELAFDPGQRTEFSRVTFGESSLELANSGPPVSGTEFGSFPSSLDDETLVKFVSASTATITEKTKADAARGTEITISNAGLAPAVAGLLKRCGLQPVIPSTLIQQPDGKG